MHLARYSNCLAGILFGLLALVPSQAAVTTYLSNGTNPNGDLVWQAAVGSFTELDLDGFAHGQIVQNLTAGPTSITVGPGATGQQIFVGAYAGGGGVYGTISGSALLNFDANNVVSSSMTFVFSPPVAGFGLWVFDNSSGVPGSFTMTVTEVGGAMTTSGVLDANPGQPNHIVDGFIGAKSTLGITSVSIDVLPLQAFELDHLQVASTVVEVPGSGPYSLGILGLALMAAMTCFLARALLRRSSL